MAARKGPRRRPSAPTVSASTATLPLWARHAIERGRMTEEEYRDRERERAERHRADLVRHVPAQVEAEGADAVEAWADEWLAIDLRLWRGRREKGDPRAPLGYPELRQLGRI